MDKKRLQKKEDGKGWYCRGYLPHLDAPKIQFITFCLADSLPKVKLEELERELRDLPAHKVEAERRRRIEVLLDRGHGCCALSNSKLAELVEDALMARHGSAYDLHAWVIMPNHVHLLAGFGPEEDWAEAIGHLKGSTAHSLNEVLGRKGRFWQRESYDRFIRDGDHFRNARGYIHANPLKVNLCQAANEYRWGSARLLMKPRADGEFELLTYRQYLEACSERGGNSAAAPAKASAPRSVPPQFSQTEQFS